MANETVSYDLATVLIRLETRLDRIEATQTTILLNQTKLESEMKTGQDGLAKRLDNIEMLIRIIIGGAPVAFVGGIFILLFTQLKSTLQML